MKADRQIRLSSGAWARGQVLLLLIGLFQGPAWADTPSLLTLKPRQAIQWLETAGTIPRFSYRIVTAYPHDPKAFTQGLLYNRGRFYESTGLRGHSTLREIEPATGRVLRQLSLPGIYFGEGLVLHQERLVQLTWLGHTGFVYDRNNFTLLDTFYYPTEGWGLTHNGDYFIQSDGSDRLFFHNLDTFQLHHTINVRDGERSINRINELEFIHGRIWANIWQTQLLAIIDPQTGQVQAWVDLTGLAAEASDGRPESVLNGIAHDPEEDRLWVTGKRWSRIFEIELIPPTAN